MDIEQIILIGGIILQGVVNMFNKLISAILGFALTAFLLIWGLSIYRDGGVVTFFGMELPQVVFIIACALWFAVDVFVLVKAIQDRRKVQPTAAPPAEPTDVAL